MAAEPVFSEQLTLVTSWCVVCVSVPRGEEAESRGARAAGNKKRDGTQCPADVRACFSAEPTLNPDLFNHHRVCPYAQRVVIALHEKGIPFTPIELATKNAAGQWGIPLGEAKPSWFTKLAPEGKVPTLIYKEEGHTLHVIPESGVLLDFLEDYHPAPPLLPPHPACRAAARLIVRRIDDRFVPPFYKLLRGNLSKTEHDAAMAALGAEIEWLEAHADSAGPFLCGRDFSIADAALIPFFLRMFELRARAGFELPSRCTRLIRWYGAVADRPSVGASLELPEGEGDNYETALQRFFVGYLGPRPAAATAAEGKGEGGGETAAA